MKPLFIFYQTLGVCKYFALLAHVSLKTSNSTRCVLKIATTTCKFFKCTSVQPLLSLRHTNSIDVTKPKVVFLFHGKNKVKNNVLYSDRNWMKKGGVCHFSFNQTKWSKLSSETKRKPLITSPFFIAKQCGIFSGFVRRNWVVFFCYWNGKQKPILKIVMKVWMWY